MVDSAQAAAAHVARVASRDATHNCWAWRIGAQYRFSDDGEPGGSAGRPILAAIDGQGLDRVAVVVTRWYGGIKLGVGGLARAYGGCAAECLRVAERMAIVERVRARIGCAFADAPLLYARLRDFDARRTAASASADGVVLSVEVARDQSVALAAFVRDLTRGRGSCEITP
jgi:putative IMPACT (imprinted ancient) family translation regulator